MENQPEEKKKRIRKKTCEIDSINKLRTVEILPKQRKVKAKEEVVKKDLNQSHISSGRFNFTIRKSQQMTPDEVQKYFDEKFEIEESEKTSKLVVREYSDTPIPEPITEKICLQPEIQKKNREIHELLSKFVKDTKETWPAKTDISCWHCTYSFNDTPIPCPIGYDEIRKRYKVTGIFCSWACVARFSIDQYESLATVYRFRNELLDEDDNIPVALPRYCLDKFGGPFKIEKFRTSDSKNFLLSTDCLSYVNQEIIEFKT